MASLAEYREYRTVRALEGLAAFAWTALTLEGETPWPASGLLVSCDYFAVLRAVMATGRGFAEEECSRAVEANVVVLSHGAWQRWFGGDASVLGRTLTINRTGFTVIGITEASFGGSELRAPDLWMPVTAQPQFAQDRLGDEDMGWLSLVGRLRGGVGVEQASEELSGIAHRRDAEVRGRATTLHVNRASFVSGPSRRLEGAAAGVIALVVASVIVLMACLNVMNLLLARAPVRRRSLRVRLSLGASRGRLLSQLLVESVLLALIGCIVALVLAYWAPQLLVSSLPFAGDRLDLRPDARVIGWAVLISMAAAAVFGVAPALEATRVDLATAMRGDSAGVVRGRRGARLRQGVVAIQLAGSLMLLAASALLVRSLLHARSMDPGFRVEGIHGFQPNLAQLGYDRGRGIALLRELRTRVASSPGIEAVALAAHLPFGARSSSPFRDDDGGAVAGGPSAIVDYNTVSSGWFETMDISIVRGRGFIDADERAAAEVVAVVTESMAGRFWPAQDPIGRHFRAGDGSYQVVGVARDARSLSLGEPDRQFFYAAARLDVAGAQGGEASRPPGLTLIVRASPGSAPAAQVTRIARELEPAVLLDLRSLESMYDGELQLSRRIAWVAGLLGSLAALLALVGVYGAVAYAASQRRHEIGLRIALGAERRDILLLLLRQGVAPLVVGAGTGVLLAAAASLLARSLLFGLPPLDPIAFAGTTGLLTAAALAAMLRPARRAAAQDPMRTLRQE
jgi:predicted permease